MRRRAKSRTTFIVPEQIQHGAIRQAACAGIGAPARVEALPQLPTFAA